MTLDDIKARVEVIRKLATEENDDEAAHGSEDCLYDDLLRHMADSAPEPWATLAREALKTQEIKFCRWCA